MWFAAMSSPSDHQWFTALLVKLLEGDRSILGLLRTNPFPDRPPKYIRALYNEYRFTTPEERRVGGGWWRRTLIGLYYTPATLKARDERRDPALE